VKPVRDSQPELHIKQNRSHIFTVLEEEDSECDSVASTFVEQMDRRGKATAVAPSPDQAEKVLQEVILEPAPVPVSSKGTNLVCSTPARDVNVLKLLHGKAVSICSNADAHLTPEPSNTSKQADIVGNKVGIKLLSMSFHEEELRRNGQCHPLRVL